jgi:steroid delta-isomerase-like uncharacterized protein
MSSENAQLARRFFEEAWNQQRSETIDELLTPMSTCESEAGILNGPEEFKAKVYRPFLAAFPDLRITIEGTVAEGDQVVVRWTAAGTHTGDGLGLPATGRRVTMRGMTWIRFAGGKMIEGVDCWNQREMIESLR